MIHQMIQQMIRDRVLPPTAAQAAFSASRSQDPESRAQEDNTNRKDWHQAGSHHQPPQSVAVYKV
ncbi:hypothetical protein EYF80_056872 [Liparis tanakae]|uniref:Uncharacterized protein n=1 Tax=Liparis tanakae TaxID=230148 RepID=A0A4Z2EX85_9TELE|nr:hypothetical protein EYF80_056872 [Liparis tanakae]